MSLNQLKLGTTLILLSSVLIAYQNCSRAQFTSDSSTSVLKLEGDVGVDPTAIDNVSGIDPTVGSAPAPLASPTPMVVQPGKNPNAVTGANGDGKTCNQSKDNVLQEDMVECEMVAPNSKVILAKVDSLGEGSNAQVSRVCMSENACLKLINEYAAGRGCKMTLGKADSNSQTQCAKIFPGSKGTCKNAARLSDTQIKSMLEAMAK
ncbi:MAG: hypothetical protein IPM97_17170 [Bdellovibrionaceae bacterium]|nr:hypothetical protein [Pseudobdellovibrionaceae bacterium]